MTIRTPRLEIPPHRVDLDMLVDAEARQEILDAVAELAALEEPLRAASIRAWRAIQPVDEIATRATGDLCDLGAWTGVNDLVDHLALDMQRDLEALTGEHQGPPQASWFEDECAAHGLDERGCYPVGPVADVAGYFPDPDKQRDFVASTVPWVAAIIFSHAHKLIEATAELAALYANGEQPYPDATVEQMMMLGDVETSVAEGIRRLKGGTL